MNVKQKQKTKNKNKHKGNPKNKKQKKVKEIISLLFHLSSLKRTDKIENHAILS